MSLAVITGLSSSKLQQAAAEETRLHIERGEEILWLAPTHHLAKHYTQLLLDIAPLGAKCTTLSSYIESLWELYGNGEKLVDSVIRTVMLTQVLEGERVWHHIARPASFAGLRDALATLASVVVDPHKLQATTAVERETRAMLIEYFDALEQTEFIERGRALDFLKMENIGKSRIVVIGFSEVSSQELTFIKRVSLNSDVSCYFEWAERFPQTEICTSAVEALLTAGATHTCLAEDEPRGEIETLTHALWHREGAVIAQGNVALREAAGEGLEPILLASIVEDLLKEGYREEDIAIAHPALAKSYKKVGRALEQRAIPYTLDVALTLRDSSFGKAFISLAKMIRGEGTRADALAYLHSPYSMVDPEKTYALDERWREQRITVPEKLFASMLQLDSTLSFYLKSTQRAEEGPVGEDWARHWAQIANLLLANANRCGESEAIGEEAIIDPLDAAAHTTLMNALSEAAEAGPSMPKDLFFGALGGERMVTGGTMQPQTVLVTEPKRLEGRTFKAVIFAGLSSSEFPAGGDESASDRLLSAFSLERRPEKLARQRRVFYGVLCAAKEKLFLTRTSKQLNDEACLASPFYEDVKALYLQGSGLAFDDPDALAAVPCREGIGFAHLEDVVGRHDGERRAFGKGLREKEYVLSIPDRGTPLAEVGKDLGDGPFSSTKLEDYLSCPYRWFYARALTAKEFDAEFDNRKRGTIGHEVIEKFYNYLIQESDESRVRESNVEKLLVEFERVFDEVQESYTKLAQLPEEWAGFESLRRQIKKRIREDVDLPEGLYPQIMEWSFGMEGKEPVVLEGMPLQGKVDRIDAGEGRAVLFDYKSSGVYSYSDMVSQKRIQAALYAAAVEQEQDVKVVASLYRSIKDGAVRGVEEKSAFSSHLTKPKDLLEEDEWDEMILSFLELAHEAVDGIKKGEIAPAPDPQSKPCTYCDAWPICEARL